MEKKRITLKVVGNKSLIAIVPDHIPLDKAREVLGENVVLMRPLEMPTGAG